MPLRGFKIHFARHDAQQRESSIFRTYSQQTYIISRLIGGDYY